ncbi:MAG: LysM peptidoglycan-binding domain-containing protein [Desulfobacteraceae bacterium]|nr:LysM peptidoglycan-binding domain-containing protein [Desulfobacteraceae bacterium]MBC2719043.1 LysM peptidoglycan-binding domain-containing protein [Desulfobacteraceae bacterium]
MIFVSSLILFLLCGCVQKLQKTSVHQHKKSDLSEFKRLPDTKPTHKANNATNKSALINLTKTNQSKSDIKSDEYTVNNSGMIKIHSVLDEALDFCQAAQDFWQKGELENALEALDQAYSLILDVDTDDDPNLIQQKEDLRFMISKRILEIYASRNIVVNGNHNAIPIILNKHVKAEIDLFTTGGEKRFFREAYKRSGRYRPHIVSELKKAGLPVELSWLPLIESGFNVVALSKARALGLWQFIPSTGYKFGLKRDLFIDERIDPVKSTRAAIAYLKELHNIFGDWNTVLASYNCGEGRVLRVIRSQNINYLDDFWDLYQRLPQETARYVPRFLATLHIIKNLEKYGLDSIKTVSPFEYESISVSKQAHLNDIAKNIGTPEKILKELNPELRYNILPSDQYSLRIPPGKGEVLLSKLNKIPICSPPKSKRIVYHKVRPGETLSTIARRYRTSVKSIARANNIRKNNLIVAGKKLKIPQRGAVYRVREPKYKHTSKYIVKRGDSLWIIARRFDTTTKKLQKLNNLLNTHLHIGQMLKIPGQKQSPAPAKESLRTYLVKRGDSSFRIAKKHNVPLERFLRTNNLTPRSKIYPGQKVYVE